MVDVILQNNVKIKDVIVCETAIGNQGIDLLVGMDIILLGDFAVSNYENKTAFSFRIPSQKKTDYVKELKIERVIGVRHGKGKRKRKN